MGRFFEAISLGYRVTACPALQNRQASTGPLALFLAPFALEMVVAAKSSEILPTYRRTVRDVVERRLPRKLISEGVLKQTEYIMPYRPSAKCTSLLLSAIYE